jgi:hypothetical protein
LAGDRWVTVVGFSGAAFVVTGVLFLVFGGPMEPPAAGSGGVAPVLDNMDDGWTEIAAYVFLILGALLGSVWCAVFALPKLRALRR